MVSESIASNKVGVSQASMFSCVCLVSNVRDSSKKIVGKNAWTSLIRPLKLITTQITGPVPGTRYESCYTIEICGLVIYVFNYTISLVNDRIIQNASVTSHPLR